MTDAARNTAPVPVTRPSFTVIDAACARPARGYLARVPSVDCSSTVSRPDAARRPLQTAFRAQFPVVPLTIVKATLLHRTMGPATVYSSTGVLLGYQTG